MPEPCCFLRSQMCHLFTRSGLAEGMSACSLSQAVPGYLRSLLKSAFRAETLTEPGTYGDGSGLYLQVRGPEERSCLFRFKLHGRPHLLGLGALTEVSLAEAHEGAMAARKLVRQGIDPIEQRRASRAEQAAKAGLSTFSEVADAYIAAHEASWRKAKHRQQWRNTLDTYAFLLFCQAFCRCHKPGRGHPRSLAGEARNGIAPARPD